MLSICDFFIQVYLGVIEGRSGFNKTTLLKSEMWKLLSFCYTNPNYFHISRRVFDFEVFDKKVILGYLWGFHNQILSSFGIKFSKFKTFKL